MMPFLLLGAAVASALQAPAGAAGADFWAGKRVLLAGASSGLGEALASELSARGATLVLAARRADRLAEVASACASADGIEPAILPIDVTSRADILEAHAAEAAQLLRGPVDVLCYACLLYTSPSPRDS